MAARDRQISSLYTQALRFGNVTLEKKTEQTSICIWYKIKTNSLLKVTSSE
jgi:hypothetical protein